MDDPKSLSRKSTTTQFPQDPAAFAGCSDWVTYLGTLPTSQMGIHVCILGYNEAAGARRHFPDIDWRILFYFLVLHSSRQCPGGRCTTLMD
jgi:hypothetical protein